MHCEFPAPRVHDDDVDSPYRVDDKIEPHEVLEALVVIAHHGAVVAGVIQRQVLLDYSVLELAPVDERRHLWHLGDHVQDVFVRVLPVLLLVREKRKSMKKNEDTRGAYDAADRTLQNSTHQQRVHDRGALGSNVIVPWRSSSNSGRPVSIQSWCRATIGAGQD